MEVVFNNRQQAMLPLPQPIEAAEQLRGNPQQLAHRRNSLHDQPPPPYSQSGETTEPPTYKPPGAVDKLYEHRGRSACHFNSAPINQFKSQANRECERLYHQLGLVRYGRRQTLSWDNSLDPKANSENNVRSRWVEQGIWGEKWGPAWPQNSPPLSKKWGHKGGGPFLHYASDLEQQGARWGHEEPDPEPAAEPEPEPEPECLAIRIFGRPPKPPRSPQPIGYEQTACGLMPIYPIPIPTVRNPEASRPYQQFMYQVAKEREWIRDEMDFAAPGIPIDLDILAYQSAKKKTGSKMESGIRIGMAQSQQEDLGNTTSQPLSGSLKKRPRWHPVPLRLAPSGDQYANIFRLGSPNHKVENNDADGGSTGGLGDLEANAPALEHGDTVTPPRRPKRTRRVSDTLTDEQPRKRLRGNTQHPRNNETEGASTTEGTVLRWGGK